MEDSFERLRSQGKNTVDGIIQWLKESKIIDNKRLTEAEFQKSFAGTDKIDYDKFKETLEELGKAHKQNIEILTDELSATVNNMETAFEDLKKAGKNDVDSLISWMKESKIIGAAKEAEDKARKLFEGADPKNVDLSKFKEAIAKIAEEQKKTIEDLTKSLAEQGPKLMDALVAGASAFKEAMTKK